MAVSRHLGFNQTAKSTIRSADPENPSLEPNLEWNRMSPGRQHICTYFMLKIAPSGDEFPSCYPWPYMGVSNTFPNLGRVRYGMDPISIRSGRVRTNIRVEIDASGAWDLKKREKIDA